MVRTLRGRGRRANDPGTVGEIWLVRTRTQPGTTGGGEAEGAGTASGRDHLLQRHCAGYA